MILDWISVPAYLIQPAGSRIVFGILYSHMQVECLISLSVKTICLD